MPFVLAWCAEAEGAFVPCQFCAGAQVDFVVNGEFSLFALVGLLVHDFVTTARALSHSVNILRI